MNFAAEATRGLALIYGRVLMSKYDFAHHVHGVAGRWKGGVQALPHILAVHREPIGGSKRNDAALPRKAERINYETFPPSRWVRCA